MGLFDKIKVSVKESMGRQKEAAARMKELQRAEEAQFKVNGLEYHMDNVGAVGQPNPDYDKRKTALIKEGKEGVEIYKISFGVLPCELVREPDNEFDKNAVRVEVSGLLIGYISKRQNKALLKLLDEKKVLTAKVKIGGGPYKCYLDDRTEKGERKYSARVFVKYVEV